MKPIVFDECFGWLHVPLFPTGRGAVLCAPLGHEALWTHKLIRALAERLVAKGVTVLRFDYPSSGNSGGDELDDGRLARSERSIAEAVDFLRAQTGVSHVTLCGVRFGASLAVLAMRGARTGGGCRVAAVDSFVAIAPVVRGRQYVRELRLLKHRGLEHLTPAELAMPEFDAHVQVWGSRYSNAMVDEIAQLNLVQAVKDAEPFTDNVLVVDSSYGDGPLLADAFKAQGARVVAASSDDLQDAIGQGLFSRLPHRAIESVVNWMTSLAVPPLDNQTLLATCPSTLGQQAVMPRERSSVAAMSIEAAVRPAPRLELGDMYETPVQIGGDMLFGMLCTPTDATARRDEQSKRAPLLLIVTTAATPSPGDGRLSVRLARSLARQGIASLRIDIGGVGDSGPEAPDEQIGLMYSPRAVTDVEQAARWCATQGYANVIAFGLCSGAYTSLHAAAREPAIVGVVAVNLARFVWGDDLKFMEVFQQNLNSTRAYYSSMGRLVKWRRLWGDKRKAMRILGLLANNTARRCRVPFAALMEHCGFAPAPGSERAAMRALERKGVDTLLLYGALDPGVDELSRHFGHPSRAFWGWKHVKTLRVPNLDHGLRDVGAGERVMELVEDYVTNFQQRHERLAPRSAANAWAEINAKTVSPANLHANTDVAVDSRLAQGR